ncbi:MAG TPA: hypothetical protein VMW91_08175 [Desulfosporosinus sp.]|nr:hypothetical protein [Desulfosporosinus sp.]
MICPKCKFEQEDQNIECLRCGIIFEKYGKHHNSNLETNAAIIETNNPEIGIVNFIKNLFFYVKPEINPFFFGGRIVIFLVMLIWGWKFIFTPLESNYTGTCFLHLVNLPFHEAGHIIFRPFGKIITSLGGSLAQLLMPLICLLVFLIQSKDTFGASVSFWWLGENFMDIAPYINDARALKLPLLGGNTGLTSPYGFHDWEFILTELGLLRYNRILASIAYKMGIILMLISLVWAGYLIFKQYQNLD